MKINKAMILAAGFGTRMQPLTLKTPKPLIKIGSYNLLERSINLLIEHGIKELVINVHHLADQIENFIKKKILKLKLLYLMKELNYSILVEEFSKVQKVLMMILL